MNRINRINSLLEKRYGKKTQRPLRGGYRSARRAAIDELVLTILSQNTSDVNSSKAFESLKRKFRSWKAVETAQTRKIANAIRSGGLANIKAVRIKGALREIERREGALSLNALRQKDTQAAFDYLRSIRGVGPKTAACVLLFSFQMPIMPVDTHIYRVSRRLGIVEEKASPEEAQRILTKLVEPRRVYQFHINMIKHGRRICIARNPRCLICPLKKDCKYYAENWN